MQLFEAEMAAQLLLVEVPIVVDHLEAVAVQGRGDAQAGVFGAVLAAVLQIRFYGFYRAWKALGGEHEISAASAAVAEAEAGIGAADVC